MLGANLRFSRLLAVVFGGWLIAVNSLPADEPTAAQVLTQFREAWKPQRGYMRPLDDAGWKVRLESFQKLVRLGDKATPALTESLVNGDAETRIFAAQALAFLAEPSSRPTLEKLLKDSEAAVRLYAIDALSMFGKLNETDQFKQLRDKDSNRDVKSHTAFALSRDDEPNTKVIRQALLDYGLQGLDAARVGKAAPDFTLIDALGKTFKLSDYRGKKPVVLVFIYGDT